MNAQAEAASVVHYDVNVWNYREGKDAKPLPCGSPEVGIVYLTDDINAVTCEGCKKALFQIMTSTLKRQPDALNGRRVYITTDGRFYAWKNPEWGWSVGRIVRGGEASLYGYEERFHIEDVRTLRDARLAIARLQDNDKKDEE